MNRPQRPYSYAVALLAVLGSLAAKLAFEWALGDRRVPFITFFLAVVVGAWYGGGRAGLLATAASAVTAWWFLIEPTRSPWDTSGQGYFWLAFFVAEGVLISLMCERLHVARHEADRNADQARASEAEIARTKDELVDSQRTFRRLVDANVLGVMEAELGGRVVSANDAFLGIVGYDRAEIEAGAVDWLALTAPEFRDRTAAAVEQYRRGEAVLPFPKEYVRKDGTRVPVLVGGAKVAGADRAIKFVIDLSERRRAEAECALAVRVLEAIVDGALGAVVRADLEGRILDWNSHAEELFGRTRADAIGRMLHETIIPSRFRAAHLAGLDRFRKTGEGPILGQRIEVAALAADGREFPVELLVTPIQIDGGTTFCAFARDISDRKRHEDDLQRAKEEAERAQSEAEQAKDDAERAQADAERAADEARLANRTKSEFLANISHELRTPMNAILGMTDLALGEELSGLTRDYLSTAHDAATGLLYLLNDLLDFSRMEAGRFELEPAEFDLRDALDEVMKTLAVRADEKRLELALHVRSDVPASVVGDPRRLQQVVMNVAGNAIKFTEAGEVVVTVEVDAGDGERGSGGGGETGGGAPGVAPAEAENDSLTAASVPRSLAPPALRLRFSVSDTGMGIAPEDRHRIFAPFTQADASTTRRFTGTGLGLAISHELVEMMGGSIWVDSEFGHGSTFRWTARFGLPEETAERPTLDDLRELRALVVDDNATNRQIVMEILAGWGVEAVEAPGGVEAADATRAAAAEGRPFGLFLVDALMPDVDGFMLLAELGREGLLTGATIVMLSSADRATFDRKCRELRLDGYLVKPVSQSDLLDAILSALRPSGPDAAGPASAVTGRPLRILLAEDTPANQKVVKAVLAKRGHAIDVAANGREAIDMHLRGDYDLILMDVQMPGTDGFQATAAIRCSRDPAKASIPILAMTAHAMRGDRERCLNAGMDAHLTKPIDAGELIDQVESHAGRRSEAVQHPAPDPASDGGPIAPIPSPPPAPADSMEATAMTDPADAKNSESSAADPPVNREVALDRLGHDEALFHDFARSVLDEAPGMLSEIRAAVAAGDLDAAHRVSHGLKGMLATLEARPSTAAAGEIERLTKEDRRAEAAAAVPRLASELARLAAALADVPAA